VYGFKSNTYTTRGQCPESLTLAAKNLTKISRSFVSEAAYLKNKRAVTLPPTFELSTDLTDLRSRGGLVGYLPTKPPTRVRSST